MIRKALPRHGHCIIMHISFHFEVSLILLLLACVLISPYQAFDRKTVMALH